MSRWACCVIGLLIAFGTSAGEVVCFTPGNGRTCSQSVLQKVPFKAVVTEFLDPNETTIGHSLSRLLWREVLESVYDLKGAGVILAYDARDQLRTLLDGRDYRDVLQHDYHNAATKVGQQLGTQMTLWGAVLESEGIIHAEPYLTLLPGGEDRWNQLRLSAEGPQIPPLAIDIGHDRLNFAPLQTDRATLFRHGWLTRCRMSSGCPKGIEVRQEPGNESAVVDYVPVGSLVMGLDMHEQWVRITGSSGTPVYINVFHLEIVSPAIHVLGKSVRLRTQPDSKSAPANATAMAGNTYVTSGARRASDDRLWHQIEVAGVRGWVPPETVQRDYSFPVVHFVAGLYRYALHDYPRAVQEFQRFIERGRDHEDNVTLAAAYQYLAASKLAAAGMDRFERGPEAIADAQSAVEQTPYDPSAYVFSSLIRLGSKSDVAGALKDLGQSLDLDSSNMAAGTLVRTLGAIADSRRTEVVAPGGNPQQFEAAIRKLRERLDQAGSSPLRP